MAQTIRAVLDMHRATRQANHAQRLSNFACAPNQSRPDIPSATDEEGADGVGTSTCAFTAFGLPLSSRVRQKDSRSPGLGIVLQSNLCKKMSEPQYFFATSLQTIQPKEPRKYFTTPWYRVSWSPTTASGDWSDALVGNALEPSVACETSVLPGMAAPALLPVALLARPSLLRLLSSLESIVPKSFSKLSCCSHSSRSPWISSSSFSSSCLSSSFI